MNLYIESADSEFLFKHFNGETRHYKSDSIIFQTYEAGKYLGVLIEGVAKQALVNENGKERVMIFNKPLSFFGEISLFLGNQSLPDLTITSITDTKVVFISKEEILQKIRMKNELAFFFLEVMAQKTTSIIHHLNYETFDDCITMICGILLALKNSNNCVYKTHEEIAHIIGKNRVTVSRTLLKLKKENIILQQKGIITIKKPELLEDIINGQYKL